MSGTTTRGRSTFAYAKCDGSSPPLQIKGGVTLNDYPKRYRFRSYDVRTHQVENLHEHLVMVARFRHTDEATSVADRRDPILDIMGGGAPQGGRSPHYGRFLSQVSSQRNLEYRCKRGVI